MTLDVTPAPDETHSNKWGVWRLAGFSSPIGHKIACGQIASPLLRSLFVRAVTNKISWHLTPFAVLVPVVSPLSPTSGSTRTWRGSRRRTRCSACTRYGGERGQQSNGDALAKYQPQGLCERHRRCPTKVLIAASRHACALRAVPRPWPDGSHLHFTLSVYLSRLCCADRT